MPAKNNIQIDNKLFFKTYFLQKETYAKGVAMRRSQLYNEHNYSKLEEEMETH